MEREEEREDDEGRSTADEPRTGKLLGHGDVPFPGSR